MKYFEDYNLSVTQRLFIRAVSGWAINRIYIMFRNIELKSLYRWLVVFIAFYGICLHAGCLIYASGLFIKPLQTYFGWDRGTIAMAFTLQFIFLGLLSPFIGKAVDRFGSKDCFYNRCSDCIYRLSNDAVDKNAGPFLSYQYTNRYGRSRNRSGSVHRSNSASCSIKREDWR